MVMVMLLIWRFRRESEVNSRLRWHVHAKPVSGETGLAKTSSSSSRVAVSLFRILIVEHSHRVVPSARICAGRPAFSWKMLPVTLSRLKAKVVEKGLGGKGALAGVRLISRLDPSQ